MIFVASYSHSGTVLSRKVEVFMGLPLQQLDKGMAIHSPEAGCGIHRGNVPRKFIFSAVSGGELQAFNDLSLMRIEGSCFEQLFQCVELCIGFFHKVNGAGDLEPRTYNPLHVFQENRLNIPARMWLCVLVGTSKMRHASSHAEKPMSIGEKFSPCRFLARFKTKNSAKWYNGNRWC